MNNLTAREKGFMYVITLLIIVVLGYFFGVRTLNDKYDEYKGQLAALEQRKAYLDQIRANNATMAKEIEVLKEANKKLELTFIDKLESECVEQYVLKTFEAEGCPYLTNVAVTDIGMGAFSYPDGTTSPDGLVCMQVNVTYSTTDGYTVTQYNRTPDFTIGAEVPAATTIAELKDMMGKDKYAERHGYDEFISALKKINSENPDCIKVDSLTVSQNGAIMTLNAQISFYGTNLTNRLSVDENKAGYTYWRGESNINTDGGFIGFPYVCDKENSLWYGIENLEADFTGGKPFAAYWANALFAKNYANAGGDIKKLIGFGEKPEETETQDAKKAA